MRITMEIAAIIIGPLVAVLITVWLQRRHQKYDAKLRLFTTLMIHRKSNPPAFDWVNALNLIDVVFEDDQEIVRL